MKYEIITGDSRGMVNPGWLKSFHTYSFGRYYDPSRMGFGLLRVVNDDKVAPGMGFDLHEHDNMEIISIPLSGELLHKDTIGNETKIKKGDVQAMTAGTGVFHSEMNASENKEVEFLQIWINTRKLNVKPNYSQVSFDWFDEDKIDFIVVPDKSEKSNVVKIAQDAYLSLGWGRDGLNYKYKLNHDSNGVFVFVLEGSIDFNGEVLNRRDAVEIRDVLDFEVLFKERSRVLLIEVPMVD